MDKNELLEVLTKENDILVDAVRKAGLGDDVLFGYYKSSTLHEKAERVVAEAADTDNGRKTDAFVRAVDLNGTDPDWLDEMSEIDGVSCAATTGVFVRWIRGMELPASLMAVPEFAAAAADRLDPDHIAEVEIETGDLLNEIAQSGDPDKGLKILMRRHHTLVDVVRKAGLGNDVLWGTCYNLAPDYPLFGMRQKSANTENGRRAEAFGKAASDNNGWFEEAWLGNGSVLAPMECLFVRWIRGMELPASLMAVPEFAAAAADRLQP